MIKKNSFIPIFYRAVQENDYQLESYQLNSLQGHFIKDAFLTIIGHDSILISGLYSKTDDLNSAGVFSLIPDFSNNDLIIRNYQEYDEGFSTLYASEWEKGQILKAIDNNQVWDYHNYNLVGFEKYKDGYITFIEQQFTYMISYNATSHTLVNQRNDLIGIYVNKDGVINSIIKIPKRQEGVSIAFPSLNIHSLDKNNIQFIFNGVSARKTTSTNSITAYLLNSEQKLSKVVIPTKKDYPGFISLSDNWIKPNMVLGTIYFAVGKKK